MAGTIDDSTLTPGAPELPRVLADRIRRHARRILNEDRLGLSAKEVTQRVVAEMGIDHLPEDVIRDVVAAEMLT